MKVNFQFQIRQIQSKDGRSAAVLPEMERLPDQHGRQLQAPEGREVIH